MAHRKFDIGRQGRSCKIGLWKRYGGREVLCLDQRYSAIWHAAAPMETAFSPVFGGELHAYVGFCNRSEG